ncbi:MAG: DUF3482 domain-containing protein [Planctomycetia bacterium]|nr:DUF3482 domain-containing protein [Planctomycetia bacterium]
MNFTTEELKQVRPVIVSVIGPTNEGKTSVLRTLTGDPNFGEVNAYTGTTVRAQIQKVYYRHTTEILQLIDTPGFQMSSELLDLLEQRREQQSGSATLALDEIMSVLPGDDALWRHDLRAWREVARADLILFVANVAENPRQSLIRDTLPLIAATRKPMIVVFNNIDLPEESGITLRSQESEWRKALAEHGFFLVQVYDAHQRNFQNELQLFEKIAVHVVDPLAAGVLRDEIADRRAREQDRITRSRNALAQLLIKVAAMNLVRRNVTAEMRASCEQELANTLNTQIYAMEHDVHSELLAIWGFHSGILQRQAFDIEAITTSNADLFSDAAWSQYKQGGAVGAGLGAAAGAALDVTLLGATLGLGTLLGGAIGGVLGGAVGSAAKGFHYYQYNQREQVVAIEPGKEVLYILLWRGIDLVRKLQTRGKAIEDVSQILVGLHQIKLDNPGLLKILSRLGTRKKNLFGQFTQRDSQQQECERLLAEQIAKLLPGLE